MSLPGPLNVASPVTVREKLVDAETLPVPEPVIAMVAGPPSVAVELAVKVITCVLACVPAAKLAVTPLGRLEAASATEPLNPPTSVTVMVAVVLEFCATATDAVDAESVMPGTGFTGKLTSAGVAAL